MREKEKSIHMYVWERDIECLYEREIVRDANFEAITLRLYNAGEKKGGGGLVNELAKTQGKSWWIVIYRGG